jgi:hypothetical protein
MLFNFPLRQISTINQNKHTKKLQRDLIHLNFKRRASIKKFVIFMPKSFLVSIIENLNLTAYRVLLVSSCLYINIFTPKNYLNFQFEKETNTLHCSSIYPNNFFKVYWLSLAYIYFSFSKVFFRKVKFKGKGYYVYKNYRNTIAPQFGYSHRIYIYSWFISIRFTSKSSLIFFGLRDYDIIKASEGLQYFRKINIFTGRGVRFARQVIYSKPGKISSYR